MELTSFELLRVSLMKYELEEGGTPVVVFVSTVRWEHLLLELVTQYSPNVFVFQPKGNSYIYYDGVMIFKTRAFTEPDIYFIMDEVAWNSFKNVNE